VKGTLPKLQFIALQIAKWDVEHSQQLNTKFKDPTSYTHTHNCYFGYGKSIACFFSMIAPLIFHVSLVVLRHIFIVHYPYTLWVLLCMFWAYNGHYVQAQNVHNTGPNYLWASFIFFQKNGLGQTMKKRSKLDTFVLYTITTMFTCITLGKLNMSCDYKL